MLGKLPFHTRVVDGHPEAQLDLDLDLYLGLEPDRDFDLKIESPDNQLHNLSTALDTLCAASESLKIEYDYRPSKQLLSINISMAKREHSHIIGSIGEQITTGRSRARAILAENPETREQLAAIIALVRPASDVQVRPSSLD